MIMYLVDAVYRAIFCTIFAGTNSLAHAHLVPTADNWCTAGLLVAVNMYAVTIIDH